MNNPGGGNTAENYSYRKWQQTLRQLEAAEKRLQRMQEQRDKLLAACEKLCNIMDDWMHHGRECICGHHYNHEDNCPYILSEAAIATMKEENDE